MTWIEQYGKPLAATAEGAAAYLEAERALPEG
jgi:hypothetical protein